MCEDKKLDLDVAILKEHDRPPKAWMIALLGTVWLMIAIGIVVTITATRDNPCQLSHC